MSHAISQVTPTWTVRQTLVIAVLALCVLGVCALLARASWTAGPSTVVDDKDASAPGLSGRPARVYRDPDAPGRRF